VEGPFLEPATVVGDAKESCVAHEKVYALHPATFLFLIEENAALAPVAPLVGTYYALLVSGR
jgi:hypothetical protein